MFKAHFLTIFQLQPVRFSVQHFKYKFSGFLTAGAKYNPFYIIYIYICLYMYAYSYQKIFQSRKGTSYSKYTHSEENIHLNKSQY